LGLGDITHAISALNKSIELKPNFIYSHFNRARAFAALGNKDLARKDYEAILMIDPGNQDALDAVDALDNPPASGGDERPLPTPPPPPPPRETAKLKEARFFLDDMRKFISEESAALPIPAIAKEAANLQLALNIFDEANALRSMKQLSDLMKPFSGFEQFMKNREAARQREYALQLKQARDESAKNIYFIDSYLKANLGDPKTSALMRLREQIDDSTKTESIDEIEKTNTGLQDYIKRSHLEDSYDAIVKNLRTAPTEPPKSPVNIVSDKSKFVTEGSADDIILLYNVSPSAPNVWTNVRGDVVFQGDNASL
jgi:tetratricopeptide (TPR) repeat protein